MGELEQMFPVLPNTFGTDKKCHQYDELRAEYGDWLKDYELSLIVKARKEEEICRQCNGLPCKKVCNAHCRLVVKVDKDERQVITQYTQACRYFRLSKMKSHFKKVHIPARYVGKSFADYEVTEGNNAAVSWAQYCLKNPKQGLLLYGTPGSGKTMLVSIMAQEFINKGRRVLFGDVPTLLDELRSTFSGSTKAGETFDDLMREINEVDVLILDDLGTENTTDWALERLYMIINNRYNAGKQIIVTSNYDAAGLIKRFKGITGTRIVSRLSEESFCQAVELRGNDRRLHGGS